MPLVPYAAWSRRPRGATRTTHPIGATKGVTFHWEGPHMGDFPHAACPDKVRGIQAFHRDRRGWADIAYNALVCPHGTIYEGRGPGVKSAANGTSADNAAWYAVCYLGGERDPLTAEGKQGFRDAVAWLRTEGGAGSVINGHRDHKATACPGDVIYAWLKSGDAEPAKENPAVKLRDVFRYRLFGKKGGNRTVADVLRDLDANVAAIREDVAALRDQSTPKA